MQEQTRQHIEAVARDLFAQHGFDVVIVDEIVAESKSGPNATSQVRMP